MADTTKTAALVLAVALALLLEAPAINGGELGRLAARKNLTCILVFGDSSVDPGNNNWLPTTAKANFLPYGKDFFGGRPTGRFTNGKLATDFIAEGLGITRVIPAFLDPHTKRDELLHGVSFASASTGYDDLTANILKVASLSKQIEYLLHYKIHLRGLVGAKKAEETVRNALFVISAGTNDFIENYYLEPDRSKQFSVEGYMDYLTKLISQAIKKMHRVGGTRFAVVGVPPLGCMPIVRTFTGQMGCTDRYNQVASRFNSKLRATLATLQKELSVRAAYIDAYSALWGATQNPMKYGKETNDIAVNIPRTIHGFTVTSHGCCGSGTVEMGDSCRGQGTCRDPSKFIYWDAVHPTEKMYAFVAAEALRVVAEEILI